MADDPLPSQDSRTPEHVDRHPNEDDEVALFYSDSENDSVCPVISSDDDTRGTKRPIEESPTLIAALASSDQNMTEEETSQFQVSQLYYEMQANIQRDAMPPSDFVHESRSPHGHVPSESSFDSVDIPCSTTTEDRFCSDVDTMTPKEEYPLCSSSSNEVAICEWVI